MSIKRNFVYTLLLCVYSVYTLAEEVCYAPYGTDVGEGEFDALRSLIEIHWLYGERGEEANSSWYYDEETDTSICVIWVHRPEQVLGDPDMDALGHEAMHCFIGDFHE